MKQCKRVIQTVMDAVEIFIPSVMIVTLFVAFLIQVASRYIFKNPLVWPYELSQMAYLWVITLGCNYAQRSDDNIVFSVVYDLVPGTVKKIFTVLSDAIICGVFLAVMPKVISFYEFYFTRYSTVFKLPLGLVYFGFLIFMVISILRYLNDMVRGILELVRTKKGGDKA